MKYVNDALFLCTMLFNVPPQFIRLRFYCGSSSSKFFFIHKS